MPDPPKAKQPPGPPMTLGNTGFYLAAIAVAANLVTACSTGDFERLRGRTQEQVKQACDPERLSREECSRTLDR
jgi:hypothetical protein